MNFPDQLRIGGVRIEPATVLAPMAGVTDTVFRRLIRNQGGCGLIMTEFTSSHGIVASARKTSGGRTMKYLAFEPEEHPISAQLFGSDPVVLADAARICEDLGFDIVATEGTAHALLRNDIEVTKVRKVSEGRPNVVDLIKNGQIQLIINTPAAGRAPRRDEVAIRSTAVAYNIPVVTTVSGAAAMVNAIEALRKKPLEVRSLQEYHEGIGNA